MAPCNGTTSTPPKLVVTLPLNHSTLQWHPTMAPSNGTTSTAPCNGTLVPRPIRQSGSSPSPLLEVRTPIAIAIWGKKTPCPEMLSGGVFPYGVDGNVLLLARRLIRRHENINNIIWCMAQESWILDFKKNRWLEGWRSPRAHSIKFYIPSSHSFPILSAFG